MAGQTTLKATAGGQWSMPAAPDKLNALYLMRPSSPAKRN
jgi:hypothetical protein